MRCTCYFSAVISCWLYGEGALKQVLFSFWLSVVLLLRFLVLKIINVLWKNKKKIKLRTIYRKNDENFKNIKPRVQFYWLLILSYPFLWRQRWIKNEANKIFPKLNLILAIFLRYSFRYPPSLSCYIITNNIFISKNVYPFNWYWKQISIWNKAKI